MQYGGDAILGVNTLGMKDYMPPDYLKRALDKASQVYDVFGKHYSNKLTSAQADRAGLEAQQLQETLPGLIQSTNAKSAADTKFYPLQKEADLGHTNAQIKHVMAQTGVSNAQAKRILDLLPYEKGEYAAKTENYNRKDNPAAEFDALSAELQNTQPNTMKSEYLKNRLQSLIYGKNASLSGANIIGNAQQPQAQAGQPDQGGMQIAPNAGIGLGGNGQIKVSPMGGKNSGGKQGVMMDENGQMQTVYSPTTASLTRDQQIAMAEAGVNILRPVLEEGMGQFSGGQGYLGLIPPGYKLHDAISTYKKTSDPKKKKELEDQLVKYGVANRLRSEYALMNLRMSGAQNIGIEALNHQEQKQFPSQEYPSDFLLREMPQEITNKVTKEFNKVQSQLADKERDVVTKGFPLKGKPFWDNGPQVVPGHIDQNNQWVPAQTIEQPQQQAGNAQAQQEGGTLNIGDLKAKADRAIANGKDPEAVKQKFLEMTGQQYG